MTVVDLPAHPAQWAELVTTALLGTDRRGGDDLSGPDGPTVLLRRAARHRILDRLSSPEPARSAHPDESSEPESAPEQGRPDAPPAADRLLDELLRSPDPAVVSCWLTASAAHDRAVSAVHWTRLARLAARTTAYDRRALGDALGARGRWFLRQNPDWRRLAADVVRPPEPATVDLSAPAVALTATDVLADPEAIFTAARPWGPELVSAAYAVLGGEGQLPPPRGFATRLGVALPTRLYPSIAQAGEFYVLTPDASPGRRRTIRDRFVALELAAYARAAIDHAFGATIDGASGTSIDGASGTSIDGATGTDTGFTRAEIPHV